MNIVEHLRNAVARDTGATAVVSRAGRLSYAELLHSAEALADRWAQLDVAPGARVAIWLPKQLETIIGIYAAAIAGLVFVPVNPALKPAQVVHILRDSGADILLTSAGRLALLDEDARPLHVMLVDVEDFTQISAAPGVYQPVPDTALAALLYTSGSTGLPKGVMLSHDNLARSAASVQRYLQLTPADRVLSVLPLSFDYGLNQITSTIAAGGSVVLFEYLFARDVIAAVAAHQITGLGAVPPLWIQLAALDLATMAPTLQFITNSGGRMPEPVIRKLHAGLPTTRIFLMYGLTEAFRSSYLPPDKVLTKPASVGQAIPDAHLKVVRADGTETAVGEIGELVHAGPLVAQGYWRDAVRTAERFRPAPGCFSADLAGTAAVWSGDQFVRDMDGDLTFVGRADEMIKTSGYRVSPTEIEEAVYATGLSDEAVAFAVPHATLGEAVGLVVRGSAGTDGGQLMAALKSALPSYMIPQQVDVLAELPRSANGKLDRAAIIAAARATWTQAA